MKFFSASLLTAALLSPATFSQNADTKKDDSAPASAAEAPKEPIKHEVDFEGNGTKYHFTFDSTVAPVLTVWMDK